MAVPSYTDPEGCSVTSSVNIPPAILSVTAFSSDVVTVTPPLNSFSLVGSHVIQVILTDFCGDSSSSNLNVMITNSPPYFTVASFTDIVTPINLIGKMALTEYADAEGHTVTLSLKEYSITTGLLMSTAPSFARITSGSAFEIQF